MKKQYTNNEDRILRFGGEYEPKNVNILNSKYEARKIFFRLIGEERPIVALKLLRIINSEYLPQHSDQLTEKLREFFILNLFKRDYYDLDLDFLKIDHKIRHTPLLLYLDYLFKKQDELNLIKEKIKQKRLALYPASPISNNDARKESIEKLMKWSKLQNDDQAKDLCDSLKEWATTYNLTDEWCLDFALDVLKNYKIKKIDEIDSRYIDIGSTPPDELIICTGWYSSVPEEIWARTVQRDTWWNRNPFWQSHPKQPVFQFKWMGEVIEDMWHPQSRPGYFRERIEQKFWEKVLLAMPSSETFVGQLQKFSGDLLRLDDQIEKYVEKAKRFYEELAKSTKEVDKEYVMTKTPEKDTGFRDFYWLIDFQIPKSAGIETLSGSDIANKHRLNGLNARKVVDDAVNRLCKLLCLTKHTQKRGTRKKTQSLK